MRKLIIEKKVKILPSKYKISNHIDKKLKNENSVFKIYGYATSLT